MIQIDMKMPEHCVDCPFSLDNCCLVLGKYIPLKQWAKGGIQKWCPLKEQEEERRRMISWLGKFCRHIDNGDKWLSDKENIAFFKEKMKQQFGWDTD